MSIFTEAERSHLRTFVETTATTPEEILRVFDSLKSKQKIEIALKAVMGMNKAETGTYTPMLVGRRSTSKKYGVESLALLPADGSKPHRFQKITLRKRNGKVTAAISDMGATLIGIKVL